MWRRRPFLQRHLKVRKPVGEGEAPPQNTITPSLQQSCILFVGLTGAVRSAFLTGADQVELSGAHALVCMEVILKIDLDVEQAIDLVAPSDAMLLPI